MTQETNTQNTATEETIKVLVICDIIPEKSYIAKIDMTEEEYQIFKVCHMHYVNVSRDEHATDVAVAVSMAFNQEDTDMELYETELQRKYFAKWESTPYLSDISDCKHIIRTGEYL